jgi:hypothetical protein
VTRTVPSVIATGFAADDDTCHSGNPIGATFANIAHNWPANRQMAANLSGIAARELDPNIGTIAVTCRFHYSHVEKRYDEVQSVERGSAVDGPCGDAGSRA